MSHEYGAPIYYEETMAPRRPKPFMKPRNFLLVAGTCILSLVIILPMLDAFRLMNDSTFVFFLGRTWPMRIIWACLGSVFLYQFLLVLLFACAREEAKTDTSMYILLAIVLTTTGISLLTISVPLKAEVMAVHEEIFSNCQFGTLTQRLYEYSTVLQGIRAQPACAMRTSVAMCDGYQESMPYTGFLYALEKEYSCAGFCFGNSTGAAAMTAVSAEPVVKNTFSTTVQASPVAFASKLLVNEAFQTYAAQNNQQASLLEVSKESASKESSDHPYNGIPSNYGNFASNLQPVPGPSITTTVVPNATLVQPGRSTAYPPTLFSTANYQASCDGMAARDLKFQGLTTAQMIQFEGIFLLLVVMASSVMAICGLCVQIPKSHLAGRTSQPPVSAA